MDQFPEASNDSLDRGSAPTLLAEQFASNQDVTERLRRLLSIFDTTQRRNEDLADDIVQRLGFLELHMCTTHSMWPQDTTADDLFAIAGLYGKTNHKQNLFGAGSVHCNRATITQPAGAVTDTMTRNKLAAPPAVQSGQSEVRDLIVKPPNFTTPPSGYGMKKRIAGTFDTEYETLWTCAACNGFHPMVSCLEFLKMPVYERSLIFRKTVCPTCLRAGHRAQDCSESNIVCTVPGCDKIHHGLVHELLYPDDLLKTHPFRQEIVPVIVRHKTSYVVVLTNAYLTPLIKNAVCSIRLLDKLEVNKNSFGLGVSHDNDRDVDLTVQGVNMPDRCSISDVRVAKRLPEVEGHILDNATAMLYSRTFGIELTALQNSDIDLMIGFDALGLSWDSIIIGPPDDERNYNFPAMRFSKLGWSLFGPDFQLPR